MRSFYLARDDGDLAEIYWSEQQAVSLNGCAHEHARKVFLCIPNGDGGFTADDVTERLAALWWRDEGDASDMRDGSVLPDIHSVPAAYRPMLAGKVFDLLEAWKDRAKATDVEAQRHVEAA
jgi:hypothetical protein